MIEKKRLAASLADSCGTTWMVCSSLYMLVEPSDVSSICLSLLYLPLQCALNDFGAMRFPASAPVEPARLRIAAPQTSWLGFCRENLI